MFHIIHDNKMSAAIEITVFYSTLKAFAQVLKAHGHPAIELLGLINWFMEANHMTS